MTAPPDKPTCRTCWLWTPEPWTTLYKGEDAFCIALKRRTPIDFTCPEHEESEDRPTQAVLGPERGKEQK